MDMPPLPYNGYRDRKIKPHRKEPTSMGATYYIMHGSRKIASIDTLP